MAEKIKLVTLDIDIEKLINKNAKVKEALDKQNKSIKSLKKEYSEQKIETEDYTKELVKLEATKKTLMRDDRLQIKLVQAYTDKQKQAVDVIKKTDGSIDQLQAALGKNRAVYRSLSKEQRENADIGGVLIDTINDQDKEYKNLSKQIGVTQVDVGAYKQGMQEALEATMGSGQALGGFIGGMKGAIQTSKAFIATPIGAVIGALSLVFMAVANAVKSNEDRMLRLKKAIAPVTAIINVLSKALNPLADLLIDGISKGLQTATTGFLSLINGISAGLKFLGLQGASEGVADYNKKLKDSSQLAVTILQQEKNVRLLNRAYQETNAQLQGQIDRQQQIAGDATLSFQQQQAASLNAARLRKEQFEEEVRIANLEEKLADNRVQKMKLQGELDENLLDAQKEATAKRIEVEQQFALFQQENATQQRQLAQDIFEQDLDFIIDVGAKRIEEAQKAAENEKLSFAEREKNLNLAKQRNKESFEDQMKLFEQVGLSRKKINELVNESNAAVIASELKKTSLSEIERNRFREVVIERQNLVKGLAEAEIKLNDDRVQSSIKSINDQIALEIAHTANKRQRGEADLEFLREQLEKTNELRQQALTKELEDGIIKKLEYDRRKLELETNYLAEKKVIEDEQRVIEQEEKILRDQLEFEELVAKGETIYNIKRQQAAAEQAAEMAEAKAKIKDAEALEKALAKIKGKYSQIIIDIDFAEKHARYQLAAGLFNGLAQMAGRNSRIAKIAGSATALVNTYLGVTSALKGTPPLSYIMAAATLTQGLAMVAKINAVNTNISGGLGMISNTLGQYGASKQVQGYNTGGQIKGGYRLRRQPNGDNTLITAKQGEVVLTEAQQEALGGRMAFAQAGVPGFAYGGMVGGSKTTTNNNLKLDIDLLAEKIGESVARNTPKSIIVEDIVKGVENYNNDQNIGVY